MVGHQGVVINSGPIEARDKLRNVPKSDWATLMWARRDFMATRLGHDCSCLVEFVNDAKVMFKELGFESVADMIRRGYELEPDDIAIAVRWLELHPPKEPIGLDEVKRLAAHGGDRRSEVAKANQRDGITLKRGSTGRDYILARLDRDGHAELAARVRRGELSANAAAVEAGFHKKRVRRCPKCGHEW